MFQREKNIKLLLRFFTITVTVLLIIFIAYGFHLGFFESKELLVLKVKRFGLFAPLFFIFLQAFQVVFPVIPGGASCLAGVMAFGPVLGFCYNYIGLTLGSLMAYFLSHFFGLTLIKRFFSQELVNKYLSYIKNNRFEKIFFLGILLPGAPDDLLCYIAGLTTIKPWRFLTIILLAKPLTLILYSCFFEYFL